MFTSETSSPNQALETHVVSMLTADTAIDILNKMIFHIYSNKHIINIKIIT
jgi:hypothetical protein